MEREFWQQAMDTPAEERIQRYAAAYNQGITGQFMNERNVSRHATDTFVKDRGGPALLDALVRVMDVKYGRANNPIRIGMGDRPNYTPTYHPGEPSLDEQIREKEAELDELRGRR